MLYHRWILRSKREMPRLLGEGDNELIIERLAIETPWENEQKTGFKKERKSNVWEKMHKGKKEFVSILKVGLKGIAEKAKPVADLLLIY